MIHPTAENWQRLGLHFPSLPQAARCGRHRAWGMWLYHCSSLCACWGNTWLVWVVLTQFFFPPIPRCLGVANKRGNSPSSLSVLSWLRPPSPTFHGNWWLKGGWRSWLSFSSRVPEKAACKESMRVQERGWEGTVCFQARLFGD